GACEYATAPYMKDNAGNIVNGHFPVEVSADKNTITIYPFKHTFTRTDDNGSSQTITADFYPQITRDMGSGQYQLYSMIVAPIVLTRNGATAPAAVSADAPAMKRELESIYKVAPRQAPKSRTALPIVETVKSPKVVNYRLQTAEEAREAFLRIADKRNAHN
ncbi:MAG: hypothetical protein II281_07880, partial [Alistipes sp.]|nr:hypothetical protein [Alistipes sp.]